MPLRLAELELPVWIVSRSKSVRSRRLRRRHQVGAAEVALGDDGKPSPGLLCLVRCEFQQPALAFAALVFEHPKCAVRTFKQRTNPRTHRVTLDLGRLLTV